MSLRTILSNYGFAFQRELFPTLGSVAEKGGMTR